MVVEQAQVKPSNRIVVDSMNLHMETKKIETATNMYAGRLVIKGTNDDDIVVATGSDTSLGWLGYEHTAKKYRPATVNTIYLVDAQVAMLNGAGMAIVGSIAPYTTVTKGTKLTGAAAGELTPAVIGTDDVVAEAMESVTSTSASADIMVRSRI